MQDFVRKTPSMMERVFESNKSTYLKIRYPEPFPFRTIPETSSAVRSVTSNTPVPISVETPVPVTLL